MDILMNKQKKWHSLYMNRLVERGLSPKEAVKILKAGMGDYDYTDDPNDCADDELSYWQEDAVHN